MKYLLLLITCIGALSRPAFAQIKPFRVSDSAIAETEKQAYLSRVSAQTGNASLTGTAASGNFDIGFYRCEWVIDPAVRFISGKVTSYFTITQATDRIIFDLSDALSVDSITYHRQQIGFQRIAPDGLQIQFPALLNNGQQDSVSVYYRGVPRIGGGAFTQSNHNGTPVIWTLSEPYGAKEWWPCKNGLDDKADSIEVMVTSSLAYRASSNGILVKEDSTGNERACHFFHHYPIASYLVAIAVTNYAINKDTVRAGNRIIPYISYAYPEYAQNFFGMESYSKEAFRVYTQLFGDYPFATEKYGHTQFGVNGGMEHQTNSFVNFPTPTLSAHELAHQWFGDKVTCGSWRDIWLNEGFATYLAALSHKYAYPSIYQNYMNNTLRNAISGPNGSVYVDDTTSVGRIFSNQLSYSKAAYVIHMLRWVLGDSAFYKGLRQYLNDPTLKYGFARTPDLQRNLEQASGRSLASFFQKWIYGQGYAGYNAIWFQNTNNWARVQLNQTTSHPSVSFYEMPVQLAFKNALKDTVITVQHQQNGQVFWVNPGFVADTMMIDPGYWILAKDRITQKIAPKSTLPNDIKIYPNPVGESINIYVQNPEAKEITLHLYNESGQLIHVSKRKLNGSDEIISIPARLFPAGIYILNIYSTRNTITQKILIK